MMQREDTLLQAGSQREHGNAATPSVPLRLAIGSETQQDMPLFEVGAALALKPAMSTDLHTASTCSARSQDWACHMTVSIQS